MIEITEPQARFLRSLVRMDLRSHRRAIERMQLKFGPHYDGTEHDAKTAFIEELYRALGGDPARITEHGGRT